MHSQWFGFAKRHSVRCSGGEKPVNLAVLLSLVAALFSAPAGAHSSRKPLNTSGLPIANLSHDQLRVMDRYKESIVALAAREIRPDVGTRTLYNFVNLQFAYCLWGLVPGALTNEDNPFNGCAHAYLAGSKALLEQLQRSSSDPADANQLAARIQSDMQREETGALICRNGVHTLNTAEIVFPEWSGIAFNPLLTLLGLIGFGTLAGLFLVNRSKGAREIRASQ
ncbi:hypothetical protein [Hyphomicrobium sp.]|uniref:hypothetical protein n=1 Tax=Hyphomicrobium sp. TaxID=82 RepID=UPI000FA15475|nr:hypothetical protein [Hyphomicrobium sp.]RUP10429.1 MAG: hypothetical protein EKK38_02540 [Hyphomicrobium sp.]